MATSSCGFKTSTPELLWHGGGNENGKTDPVYSLDIHPSNILVTSGVDSSVPPKGCIRVIFNIWRRFIF
jgi:hypothetical protein